ncbi:succinylglutamate desuccinylase/aspartoacylase family protein [Sphingosinicella sp. LY1275]|uniref:succinylglutamate desuccinylase/aspartoacylase family protein n=1 Tax=Sphingosinicella sp. LY1275 TaxID=3095379 RepID=UPI002ADED40D|nr:succinylglutamate desuccinylase/aspartoacylase family protein [Sphingosinicella sp. LY1275]MEA1013909.1 succinylglutamate desuccinylase/aspartoacylase family protein [Sphingosinicella sp. LY1275]
MARGAFTIGEEEVAPGEQRLVSLKLSALSNRTPMNLPVSVIHGAREGPTLFVSAAVHGDELTGVAICRRLLASKALAVTRGTLLIVPIVNAFGFIGHSRYLPDRRDLNRSFPGSPRGSLAAQLAHLFLNEVVAQCDYGIDLHSAAIHRANLPQIRVDSHDAASLAFAEAFAAPIIVHSALREGSLRQAARARGVPVIVYEAGEGLRVDALSVSVGLQGVLRAMAFLGMIPKRKGRQRPAVLSTSSRWVRAEESGLFRPFKTIGAHVREGERIGVVADPYGGKESDLFASLTGIVIGRANNPAVNQGDALFHIAMVENASRLGAHYERLEKELDTERLLDEDEIL